MNRERARSTGRRLVQAWIGLAAVVALTAVLLGPVPGGAPVPPGGDRAPRERHPACRGGGEEDAAPWTGAGGVASGDPVAPVGSAALGPVAPVPAAPEDDALRLDAWLDALRQAYGRGDVYGAQVLEAGMRAGAGAARGLRTALMRRLAEGSDGEQDRFLFDLAERIVGYGDAPHALADWHAALAERVRDSRSPWVRVRALSAVRWGVDAANDAEWTARLLDLVRVESVREVRIRAICVLGAKVPGAAATAALEGLARSHPDPDLRAAAAVALAHRDLPHVCPQAALAALTGDPVPDVRRQVGAALEAALLRAAREDAGRVPEPVADSVSTALAERLESEGDASVRVVLLRTLLSLGDDTARLAVEDHLERESDPALRRGLAAALSLCSRWDGDVSALRAALAEHAPELFALRLPR